MMNFGKKLYFNFFIVFIVLFFDKVRTEQDNQWLLNKDHQSDFETSGSKVTFKYDPKTSVIYNAMYLGLVANETNKVYYWEFTCKGGCEVGVTKKDAFADGFHIKGAFFNGNLIDGSAALVSRFGVSSFKNEEQKIAFILDLKDEELKIYIVQEDRPLGLAFVQSAPYSSDLHPTVLFPSAGSVEIQERAITNLTDLLTRKDYSNKDISGNYRIVKTFENGVEKGVEKNLPDFKLAITKQKEQISFDTRVRNHFGGRIIKTDSDAEGNLYQIQDVTSTNIAVYGKEKEDEDYYFGSLISLKRFKFSDDFEELTIGTPTRVLHFKRFVPQKEPYRTSSLLS